MKNEYPEKILNDVYEQFQYLVDDVYEECIEAGYSPDGAAGKTLSELEPMAKDNASKKILYLEMSYYFAYKNLKKAFGVLYERLKNVMDSKNVLQLHTELQISEKNQTEIRTKAKNIYMYSRKHYYDDDRSTG